MLIHVHVHVFSKASVILFQDLGLVDLEDYKYGGANITSMRLIDPARPEVLDVMSEWSITESNNGKSPLLGQPIVPVSTRNTSILFCFP